MHIRMLTALILGLLAVSAARAGTFSEALVNDLVTTDSVARASHGGGFSVSLWVILFYIFYLGTIWSFNIAMYTTEKKLSPRRQKFAKYFCRANIFLASGDSAMFIAFLVAYLFPSAFATPDGVQKLMQLLLLGVFTTSLTMSIYYFYIGLYYRERFAGGTWTVALILILVFFIIRLLLHYNPENIWFSMLLPPGQPNYSAWLRNVPLFVYGLCAVLVTAYLTWKDLRTSTNQIQRKIDLCTVGAMVALVLSFIVYAIDIFYSHKIPQSFIWIVYTVKTLAYMAALVLMWLGEFHYGRQLPVDSREPQRVAAI
jgi:hypothetical protein